MKKQLGLMLDIDLRHLQMEQWAASVNYYYAAWSDRVPKRISESIDGTESFFSVTGLNQLHTGIEYSIAYQPIPSIEG